MSQRMRAPRRWRRRTIAAIVLALSAVIGPGTAVAGPPPGRPDPRQMSGIPRVDPEVAAGTITVRCLLGGFDQPAVGVEVRLAVRSSDGATSEAKTAITDAEGRASFADLGGFVGGTAIATAELEGQTLRSQAIPIAAAAGSRVMLVAGASSGAETRPAAGADTPAPGRAFADPRFPPGTVVVGALDMAARKGMNEVAVRLTIQPPEGEAIERTSRTDGDGRAVFEGLLAPAIPAGSTMIVEATLEPSAPPQRSEPFKLGEVGVAVVFTVGTARDDTPLMPTQRRPMLPPRGTPTVPPGAVRVAILDADDRPVASQDVRVIQRSVTGANLSYYGTTGADGLALVDGVDIQGDSAYAIEVVYRGAPFRSSLFMMSDQLGVMAELRVFPTTADASRVRGAAQLEVIGRENDLAQVTQLYQVFVSGDEAYWPAEPLVLAGAEGAKGFVVMDRATADLEQTAEAPFATLKEPIPPGEVVDMSFAYLVEHDGAAKIRWIPPLPLVDVGVIMPRTLTLTKGAKGPPTPPPNAPPDAGFDYYSLGELRAGERLELEVSGLPVRPHLVKDLGWALGLVILAAVGLGLMIGDRRSLVERLGARKLALLEALDKIDAAASAGDADAAAERHRIIGELDHLFRLLDAHAAPSTPAAPKS